MNNAILVTGNTYPHRRTMRAAGALFNREQGGYVAKIDNNEARNAAKEAGLDVDEIEIDPIELEPATGDRLREQRQERIDRKRAQLIDRAERAERRSKAAWNKISGPERDFLKLGEPVKAGHHSQRRHERLLEKFDNAMAESAREANLAKELRSRAEWMMDARVKGDTARKRAERIAKASAGITVGDLIEDWIYGQWVVVKVNAKSFRVRSSNGDTHTVSKDVRLIEKREPEAVPERKFKAGDKIEFLMGVNWRPGVIKRRTPTGYTVAYEIGEYSYSVVHRESSIRFPESN